jgi:hypothetical protein
MESPWSWFGVPLRYWKDCTTKEVRIQMKDPKTGLWRFLTDEEMQSYLKMMKGENSLDQ